MELLGPVAGSGYRRPPSLVRRRDGQTIQVTPLLYQVLEAIDGRRGHDDIASVVSERVSRDVSVDDIRYLVETKLGPLGVLRDADGSQPAIEKVNPLLALRLRTVVSSPRVTRRITAPFSTLFAPVIAIPVLLAFAATSAWVLFEKGLASATHQALYSPGLLLLVVALSALSAGFHEFGHAAAVRRAGGTPGAMGVGLYLIWPVFYTDVTDAYRLPRRERLRVDVGGLYFNAIFTMAMVGVWAATGWDAILLLVPVQMLHMLRQLVPLVRFDGYHILADLTGVPDLFGHIKPTLLHMLPTRWGRREPGVLKPWARAVVTLWVLTVIPALTLALALIVQVLPRIAATVWDSVGVRWGLLHDHWADGQLAEAATALLSILLLALPVLGMSYLLVRVARRSGQRVWRATADRAVLRAMAVLAAAAAVGLLTWAWWPDGQYRPIQASERGTLTEALPSRGPAEDPTWVETSAVRPRLAPPGPSTSPRLAFVLSPRGVPVTGSSPTSIVLVAPPGRGLDESTEGEWVFPFDPPAAPEEGDNQALAVNTGDGTTVYDVAIAVVWVTDGFVGQTNEAWAVASCSRCLTVAVAFQAVLAIGGPEVATPQNLAVAVNYDCRKCETHAIAVQLIATLTRPPTDEAMAELEDVWADLEDLEESIDELAVDDLRAELVRIEAAILETLVDDGAVALTGATVEALSSDADEPSTGDAQLDGSTPGSDGDPSDDATSTDGVPADGGDPSPTPSADPSPTPSAEPSPTPSAEPSPTPSAEPSPTPSTEPMEEASPTPSPTPTSGG